MNCRREQGWETFKVASKSKSGVDVRIITPHIPDKRYVFEVTRAHYPPLLEAGVKIYEYTPGFIHAKNFVVDDRFAAVGTVNVGLDVARPGAHRGGGGPEALKVLIPVGDVVPHGEEHDGHRPDRVPLQQNGRPRGWKSGCCTTTSAVCSPCPGTTTRF